ncbi:MAG: hypothetical protein E6Q97_38470 [Desulfurellales bacterium]|nr:MAG: hypothetical protein E6Q97_38470 [Desulfurellales bacterium]
MIEGLRIAPWFFDEQRRNPANLSLISDCGKCMASLSQVQRRALNCGFEHYPSGHKTGMAWSHRGGPRVNTCPGYLIRLPQVAEVTRAHHHWSKGELQSFAKAPSSQMLEGIEILDRELGELQAWRMKDGNRD